MWLYRTSVTLLRRIFGCCSLLAVFAASAAAQGVFDAVGTRALGQAGAFVAVADDPSAVHWNPSALASGGPAGLTIGWHHFQLGNPNGPAAALGGRGRTSLTSLGTWPIGVSYGSYDRRSVVDGADGDLLVRRLAVRHAGITVLQSVMEGLVVGSTVRVLRAETAADAVSGGTLEAALERDSPTEVGRRTAVDVDLGVIATAPHVRAGLSWRNLRSLAVGATPGNAATLPRQARVGLAFLPSDGLTLAMDLELNTVDLMGDLRRMTALGAEISLGSRLLVRSGVRWNLAISSGPAGAVGASLQVRRGLWVDAHYAHGGIAEARQMSVAFRGGL